MSVLVMDGSYQRKRPWHEITSHNFSFPDQMALDSRQIPGIPIALNPSLPISAEHRLPPIATTSESRLNQPPEGHMAFTGPDGVRSSTPTTPSIQSPNWRPEKRARWRYSQDSTAAPSASTDPQIYMHQTERDYDAYSTSFGKHEHETLLSPHHTSCGNCANTHDLINSVVSSLINLEADIWKVLALPSKNSEHVSQMTETGSYKSLPSSPRPALTDFQNTSAELTKSGLRHSLLWASDSIQTSARLIHDVATHRSSLASLASTVATVITDQDQGPQISHSNANLATREQPLPRRASVYESERLEDRLHYRTVSIPSDKAPRFPSDASISFTQSTDQMKRTYQVESPHGSPLTSAAGPGSRQSPPPQSQLSSRTLPSPSAYQYLPSASSMPGSHSYSDSQATTTAQKAHLQDLQHQISTKTLALQTLQREHDQLLAAFSRSQIRCTTLDKKSQVSDHEINTLAEEKVRLQRQVAALEAQVEELVCARDEAQQQSTADKAQWQRIMSMSSRLQTQGAKETRQYRSEKEVWERDRDGLEQRVRELEAGKLNVVGITQSSDMGGLISSEDILKSTSLDNLREEILRLRRKCLDMETLLQGIKGETDNLNPALAILANVRDRISAKTQLGLPDEQPEAEIEAGERS